MTFSFSSILAFMSRRSIFSYSIIASWYGGEVWTLSSYLSLCMMFPCLVIFLSFDVYLFCPLGWWSLNLLAAGDMRVTPPPQRPLSVEFYPQESMIWFGTKVIGEIPSLWYCDALGYPYAIYWLIFLLAIVVPGPSDPCLSVINYLIPIFVAKFLIFCLEYNHWCPPLVLFDLLCSYRCLHRHTGLMERLFGGITVSWD